VKNAYVYLSKMKEINADGRSDSWRSVVL